MKRPERAKKAARPKKAVRRKTIPRKPVRDKRHPLRVLAICYGGIRSGVVQEVINEALKEMKYDEVVEVYMTGRGNLFRETLNEYDIILTPEAKGIGRSLNLLFTIQILLKEGKHKALSYEAFANDWPRETGEELVNRILRRAKTFLDLRF